MFDNEIVFDNLNNEYKINENGISILNENEML